MPRNLSVTTEQQLTAQDMSSAFLQLLTVEHAGGILRYVDNPSNIVSLGRVFTAARFEMQDPTEGEDSPPVVNLQFETADTTILTILRSDEEAPVVTIEYCLEDDPNTIEYGPMEFEVKQFTRSGNTISVSLGYEPILNEPIPADLYTSALFPGLF